MTTQSATTSDAPSTALVIGPDGLARPQWATQSQLLRDYYDTEWGYEVHGERELFERLCLECFQAGLSWEIVLKKRPALREAFSNFEPEAVAGFDEAKVQQVLENSAIIRNRKKIEAVINNAKATVALRAAGGLDALIWSFAPAEELKPLSAAQIPTSSEESAALAKALKKRGFRFVGPTTIFALMEATGMVNTHIVGSHRRPA